MLRFYRKEELNNMKTINNFILSSLPSDYSQYEDYQNAQKHSDITLAFLSSLPLTRCDFEQLESLGLSFHNR